MLLPTFHEVTTSHHDHRYDDYYDNDDNDDGDDKDHKYRTQYVVIIIAPRKLCCSLLTENCVGVSVRRPYRLTHISSYARSTL